MSYPSYMSYMSYEIIDHTADVRLRVRAPSLEALFADAMRGMFAVMRAHPGGTRVERSVAVVDAADAAPLLGGLLDEVRARAPASTRARRCSPRACPPPRSSSSSTSRRCPASTSTRSRCRTCTKATA